MAETVECPFCLEGHVMGEPSCCNNPSWQGGSNVECCGEPNWNETKCEVCDGTNKITKQYLIELKLKGINPPYGDTDDDFNFYDEYHEIAFLYRL